MGVRIADRRAVALPVFLSGVAALAYEVLWTRDWALLYGATATGAAVVLTAYFAGLAAGSWLGGRMASPARAVALYAGTEAAIGLTIVAYLALRPVLPDAAAILVHRVPAAGLPLVQTLFAVAVLLPPTALMGASLPLLSAGLAAGDAAGGAWLYAWNTSGGVLGALGAGLLGVRALGVRGTYLAGVVLNLAAAAAALTLARVDPVDTAVGPGRRTPGPLPWTTVMAAATAGFVGLAAEVLWTRGLAGVLSNSVYSVAVVLAGVLLGIVAGASLGVRVAGRAGTRSRVALALAAVSMAVVGSSVALRSLDLVSLRLIAALGVTGPGLGLTVEALLALIVVFLPACALGCVFPLCLSLAGMEAPGRSMGQVLAANTVGGIAGALCSAFVLLPRLGLAGGLALVAGLAGLVAVELADDRRSRTIALAACAVVAVAGLAMPGFEIAWRRSEAGERVLFYRDGATATVLVTADARGNKTLRVNGQYSLAGTLGLLLEAREAHLPLLLHPAPTRLLHIGVGTGDTIGAALTHPGLQVDGIELVAEVLQAAALFSTENRDVLASPRARLMVDDARSFLLATAQSYDVILSDLFLPWTAGTTYLYSRDFYRLGQAHLRPGGLYCQWLPLHQLTANDLATIVATFSGVFPQVQLWVAYHRTATPLAALIGSAAPLRGDAERLRAELADPTLASALEFAGLDDPGDLAALYVTDGDHLRAATTGVPPITDDRPRLEFTAPAAYFHQEQRGRAALAWVMARLDPRPTAGAPQASFALRAGLLRAQHALLDGDGPGELRAYLDALAVAPDVRAVRAVLMSIGGERLMAGDRATARAIAAALRRFAPDTEETRTLTRVAG